jgi:hypothetical protein
VSSPELDAVVGFWTAAGAYGHPTGERRRSLSGFTLLSMRWPKRITPRRTFAGLNMSMAKSQKAEIENLRQLLEQNAETLQRMEEFLDQLNDRLEATAEVLSGKHRGSLLPGVPESRQDPPLTS